jgi:hypothetical protein
MSVADDDQNLKRRSPSRSRPGRALPGFGSPWLHMPSLTCLTVSLVCAIALIMPTTTARAQSADRDLLATFCDAVHIKGSSCTRAKGYPSVPPPCDVTLTKNRYSGKFVASGNPLLVVTYESGCEAHATDNGGSVVYEQIGGRYVFRGYQPGAQANDCVTVAKDTRQDLLICPTGHMGQGILETGVAQMAFTPKPGKRIGMTHDMLLMAEDSIGAHGSNVVTCAAPPPKYFDLTKLRAGPRPMTVTVDASFADEETVRTACDKGFAAPTDTDDTPPLPGDAYVPSGSEKTGTFTIDLVTRKIVPQN